MTVITQAQIDAYGEVSGDRNPLHIDPAFAAQTPFGATIVHGHLLIGHIGRVIEAKYGAAWVRAGRLEIKFVAPVYAGDDISIDVADDGNITLSVDQRVCVVGRSQLTEAGES